jgi:hypothetical protein
VFFVGSVELLRPPVMRFAICAASFVENFSVLYHKNHIFQATFLENIL